MSTGWSGTTNRGSRQALFSRHARRALAVLAATIALGLVAAELGLRVFQPVPRANLLPFVETPHQAPPADGEQGSYVRFDADLGWSIGRSVRAVDDGVLFRSSAGGFRADREYDVSPA